MEREWDWDWDWNWTWHFFSGVVVRSVPSAPTGDVGGTLCCEPVLSWSSVLSCHGLCAGGWNSRDTGADARLRSGLQSSPLYSTYYSTSPHSLKHRHSQNT